MKGDAFFWMVFMVVFIIFVTWIYKNAISDDKME